MDSETARRFQALERRLQRLETKPGLLYQAGTYSPTYQGSVTGGATTYTLQQGAWERHGKTVLVWGTVVWTAATGTGNARISLPFTTSATANQNGSGGVRTVNVTFANSAPQVIIVPSTAFFEMQSPLTNAASTAVAMEAAGNIVFSAFYFVD